MYFLLASNILIQSEQYLKKKKPSQKQHSQQTNKKKFEGKICAADEQSSLQ